MYKKNVTLFETNNVAIYFVLWHRSRKITNETLIFRAKIMKKNWNFFIKICVENRENHAIEVTFWIIAISQSVAEIQELEESAQRRM